MAQFDVHRNTGKTRDAIPFVVVLQSSLYDQYRRRVVAPLVRREALAAINDTRLNPGFRIDDIDVVLHPLEIVSIGTEQLGKHVGSLANEGRRIGEALDQLLTSAWG